MRSTNGLAKVAAAALLGSSSLSAHAVLYQEEYQGHQYICEVGEGCQGYYFSFDMAAPNTSPGTNAPYMAATEDASGADSGRWFKTWLVISAADIDDEPDLLNLRLTFQDGTYWDLGTYDMGPMPGDPWYSRTQYYDFSDEQSLVLQEGGPFVVTITATGGNGAVNDLQLNRVAMFVNVPEPGVLLLLSTGLLAVGLASWRWSVRRGERDR